MKANDKNSVKFLLKLILKAVKTLWFSENNLYLHLSSNLRKLKLPLTEPWIKNIVSLEHKKNKSKIFWKRLHQNKNQKVSDSKSPWYYRTSPLFCRAPIKPTKCSKKLRIRPIVQWNSLNIEQKEAFCIIIQLNLQKSAKFYFQETFIRRLIAIGAHFEIKESVLRFLVH